jgi:hypothetical protein
MTMAPLTAGSSGSESPWFIIANSGIAFDHGINLLSNIADPEKYLLCLSRWDKLIQITILAHA